MLHDYYMYRTDTEFLRQFLPDIESILSWFDSKMDTTGLLGVFPEWDFVDWTYANLNDTIRKKGQLGIISLIYAGSLDDAADLFRLFGDVKKAEECKQKSADLKLAVNKLCYDNKRNLYSDAPGKTIFSEQMNSFAVLTDAIPPNKQKELMLNVLSDTSLIKCSAYFKFYMFRALKKAGLGDKFLSDLTLWKKMLEAGLTTFSEVGNTSKDRSDCHAWSAHPGMEFLSVVAGITPAAPGFTKVRIQPSFNNLNQIKASMPHPAGIIEIDIRKTGIRISGTVTLPEKTGGEFIWNDRTMILKPGKQDIDL